MHPSLTRLQSNFAPLCQRFGVERLEVFGSAARGYDFNPERSDADFLVSFAPETRNNLTIWLDFKDALEALLGCPVDLIEREAVEESPNYIRRNRILAEAETVYG